MYTVHIHLEVHRLATIMSLHLLFLAIFTLTNLPPVVPTSASGSGLEPAASEFDMHCMLPIIDLLHMHNVIICEEMMVKLIGGQT